MSSVRTIRKIRWVNGELECEPTLPDMVEGVLRQLTFVTAQQANDLREAVNGP